MRLRRRTRKRLKVIGAVSAVVVATAAVGGVVAMSVGGREQPPVSAKVSEYLASQQATNAEAVDYRLKVKRPASGPMRVLFTGDSLTYGLYASKQELGYRGVMVKELSKGGAVEAASSQRSGAGAGVVASIVDVPADLDLAIIELGTNDVGGQTPVPEFTKTYSDLLDKIRKKSPGVPLMCVGTWGSDGGGYGADPYNNAIAAECEKREGKFVTMYGLFPVEANKGPAGLAKFGGVSDDFHPNDTGYKAIADLLIKNLNIS